MDSKKENPGLLRCGLSLRATGWEEEKDPHHGIKECWWAWYTGRLWEVCPGSQKKKAF